MEPRGVAWHLHGDRVAERVRGRKERPTVPQMGPGRKPLCRDSEAESTLPAPPRCGPGVFGPQVNGQNVVKVGHRQVVNMIRQGGNTLMVKVVMVTRHPDMDEAVRKKGAPPPTRVARPGDPLPLKTPRSPNCLMFPPPAFPSPGLLVHDPSEEKLRHGGPSMLVAAIL